MSKILSHWIDQVEGNFSCGHEVQFEVKSKLLFLFNLRFRIFVSHFFFVVSSDNSCIYMVVKGIWRCVTKAWLSQRGFLFVYVIVIL